MPPVSKRKRRQQASLAYAKQTRWTSPECDKENVDPARVSTRSATVKRVSKRDATRAVLKERVGQLEAELKRQEDDLADARKAADTSVARASAAELRAATAERKARRWRSRVSALPPNTQSLFPSRVRFDSVLAHRDQLKKENRALKMRLSRVPGSKERAISKAVARVASSQRTMRLKSKGRVVEPVRMACRNLVASASVPASQVPAVFKIVAEAMDVDLEGSFKRDTVARAVIEGGLMAELQAVDAMRRAASATLGMDGTTHKNRNLSALHIFVVPADGSPARKFFTGIHPSLNHTSEAQFDIIELFLVRLVEVWNSSPLGSHAAVVLIEIINIIRGMHTDHAEDQKKLVRLIEAWLKARRIEDMGRKQLLQLPSLEVIVILAEESARMIDSLGGPVVFSMLDADEQGRHYSAMYAALATRMGQEAYDALSDAERHTMDFFVWTGCCMHKDLNTVKGGNTRLQEYWKSQGLATAMLPNKDNAAAMSLDPDSAAAARAREKSHSGAVWALTLMGSIFRHKNDKLGQQDSTKIWFEEFTGRLLTFPDTSNVRFQCFCTAAGVVLLDLDGFRVFLRHIRDKKESGQWTNIEKNVATALDDDLTVTELLVLAYYNEIFSHPYMTAARAPGVNGLDLGPLHEKFIAHCDAILANPDLVLSSSEDAWKLGSLDGRPWTHPEIVKCIHQRAQTLPHFRGALLAFVTGVRETFARFSAEFIEGGVVNTMTEAERQSLFVPSTNDSNEGELGSIRVMFRRYGNMSLLRHNAATMWDRNGTAEYAATLPGDVLTWIYAAARHRMAAGLEKTQRKAQAAYDAEVAGKNVARREAKATREAEKAAAIGAVDPLLDAAELTRRKWKTDELNSQLDWYRDWHDKQKTGHKVPLKTHLKTNPTRTAALQAAIVARQNCAPIEPTVTPVTLPDDTTLAIAMDLLEEGILDEENMRDCDIAQSLV